MSGESNKPQDPQLTSQYWYYLVALRTFTEEVSKEMRQLLPCRRQAQDYGRPPPRPPSR